MANEKHDEIKSLLENNVLSEDVKAAINEAWERKVEMIREEAVNTVREEFSQRYEKDRNDLITAVDTMVREGIETHIQDLNEQKRIVADEIVAAKRNGLNKIKEIGKLSENILRKEITEFREDRRAQAEKFKQFDKFVVETVTKGLVELHAERKKLAEDRVEHAMSAKKETAEYKRKFVETNAKKLAKFVSETLSHELAQLKEDLAESKKKFFGQKIFEAFGAEYMTMFVNADAEYKQMAEQIKARDNELAEAIKGKNEAEKKLNESKKEISVVRESQVRESTMAKLLAPLTGDKRKLMESLLEKVETKKLTESFNLYLPTVLDTQKEARTLTESALSGPRASKNFTGDRKPIVEAKVEKTSKAADQILGSYRNMVHGTSVGK